MVGLSAHSLRLLGREGEGSRGGQEDTVFLLHFLPVTSDILFTFGAITKKLGEFHQQHILPSLCLCVCVYNPVCRVLPHPDYSLIRLGQYSKFTWQRANPKARWRCIIYYN